MPAMTQVISTGRICSSPVRRIAAVRSTPTSISWLNCDRMMMPSITEMPNSAMNPIAAETLNGICIRNSAKIPPTTAIGMTLMVNSVSGTEPKLIQSSNAISARLSGTTTLSRAIASCRLPNSPTHSIRDPTGNVTCSATLRCASLIALPRSRSRTLNLIGR